MKRLIGTGYFLLTLFVACAAAGDWDATVEGGAVWFGRNDVRIPGDAGTRFSLLDLTGKGPSAYVRLSATRQFKRRHALRLALVPFQVAGSGTLDREVVFHGETFEAGRKTRGTYRFNTYRLAYRYRALETERQRWGLGLAALVRDAEIKIEQDGRSAARDDLGFVPLLHLRGEILLGEHGFLLADIEGAGAPQGRAIDATIQLGAHMPRGWHGAIGYRMLEGGADNDSVYTFACLHHASMSLGRRF